MTRISLLSLALGAALSSTASCAQTQSTMTQEGRTAPQPIAATPGASAPTRGIVARGEYLATIGGCDDCHTPKKIGANGPELDTARRLSGHPATEAMPPPPKPSGPWVVSVNAGSTAFAGPWGITYSANLTPDQATGLGTWTIGTFIAAMRSGRANGEPILPPMPWQSIGKLSDDDLGALFAFLTSLRPIRNDVPEAVVSGARK